MCNSSPFFSSSSSSSLSQARIAGALGGRVAEQLVFGASQVTTGAGGDLQQVERMARAMVTQFGMSDPGMWVDRRVRVDTAALWEKMYGFTLKFFTPFL